MYSTLLARSMALQRDCTFAQAALDQTKLKELDNKQKITT
jgi:hypothetical protein